jgi:hypothetical protein
MRSRTPGQSHKSKEQQEKADMGQRPIKQSLVQERKTKKNKNSKRASKRTTLKLNESKQGTIVLQAATAADPLPAPEAAGAAVRPDEQLKDSPAGDPPHPHLPDHRQPANSLGRGKR